MSLSLHLKQRIHRIKILVCLSVFLLLLNVFSFFLLVIGRTVSLFAHLILENPWCA